MKLPTWIRIIHIAIRMATHIIRALELIEKDNNDKPVGG